MGDPSIRFSFEGVAAFFLGLWFASLVPGFRTIPDPIAALNNGGAAAVAALEVLL
jgi:hypothetical protein